MVNDSKMYEILIAPDRDFLMMVLQGPAKGVTNEDAVMGLK